MSASDIVAYLFLLVGGYYTIALCYAGILAVISISYQLFTTPVRFFRTITDSIISVIAYVILGIVLILLLNFQVVLALGLKFFGLAVMKIILMIGG